MRARAITAGRGAGAELGQASVELLAVVPAVLLVGALLWQLALAGHTLWLCGNAARVAARAEAVGRDGEKAARSALPRSLERGLRFERGDGGRVRVGIRVPVLLWRWRSPVNVRASAALVDAR